MIINNKNNTIPSQSELADVFPPGAYSVIILQNKTKPSSDKDFIFGKPRKYLNYKH